jgi:hypothetical protein
MACSRKIATLKDATSTAANSNITLASHGLAPSYAAKGYWFRDSFVRSVKWFRWAGEWLARETAPAWGQAGAVLQNSRRKGAGSHSGVPCTRRGQVQAISNLAGCPSLRTAHSVERGKVSLNS